MKCIAHIIISIGLTTTSTSYAQEINSFDDISLPLQLGVMWACKHTVHQTYFRLGDIGVKVNPKNIKGVDNLCKKYLTSYYDWSSRKSESEIDPNVVACQISRDFEKSILGKKYDKMDHVKKLCFPTALCRPTASKDGYSYEKALMVYRCVKKHNTQNN